MAEDKWSIAIVIVCRNALPALKRTIESVHQLADPRVRLYVVDGASSDGTGDYLHKTAATLADWITEPDAGIYDAMNKGWRMSPTDSSVLYLGAGDLLRRLPPSSELFDAHGQPWPIVLGQCLVGTTIFKSRWGNELRLRNTAHHQALLIHRRVWQEPPFNARLRVYADWDFNLRLLRSGLRARQVEGLLTYAEPGGVSWRHDLGETYRVARRHGGPLIGVAAYLLSGWALWRRGRSGG